MTMRRRQAFCGASGLAMAFALAMLPAFAGSSTRAGGDGDWARHGRTADEQRFSPLAQIDRANVGRVGLAWEASLDSTRGIEATPIVVGDVMYVTSTWSRVFALDARTGAQRWAYDPEVPRGWGKRGCCDVVNRGVAVDRGRVFLGAFDGRLIALDAATGKQIWSVDTLIDRTKPYTITGAPRVVKDMVLIGNGGADFGVRGYVSAYDWKTGKLRWRFYTVPGNATGPFEHPELAAAARTWDPDSRWDVGGGGTVWDSMAYDSALNLVYVGTGNGAPWPDFVRSPKGGDNLYLSSILALNPDTGRLVWHYQVTPGDTWDYTATQQLVLADISWRGQPRKVLMQAPKNGFYYVIDRATGELLAADKYVTVTWASHVDMTTGRPVRTEIGEYRDTPRIVFPSSLGGHNWHPMSYSPETGLMYIPAQESASNFSGRSLSILLGNARANQEQLVPDRWIGHAVLLAWDPVARTTRWSVPYTTLANAGVLSTAGGLVVQGDAEGYINFYDAADGKRLHRLETGTGIIAPPISYQVAGEQYIAIAAGWGGALFSHAEPRVAARRYHNAGRVIALKLGGKPVTVAQKLPQPIPGPPPGDQLRFLDEEQSRGREVYNAHCGACHGWFGHNGLLPDLRRSAEGVLDHLEAFVLQGALEPRGMPSFAGELSAAQVEDLKKYLRAVRIEPASPDAQSTKN